MTTTQSAEDVGITVIDQITAADIKKIAGGRAPLAVQVAESFETYADEFGVSTPLRQAHFLAQLSHESAGFSTTKEIWGPTPAQKRYEGRADLGNTQPGDGKRFMGHALMQITGRANHREFTDWIRDRISDAPDFEAQPELLMQFPWAMLGAFWFWTTRGLNALADRDDVLGITRKINGGENGLDDRKAALSRAKAVLGIGTRAPAIRAPAGTAAKPGQWAEERLQRYEVEAIQKRLRELGYYQVGKVDGLWGPSTRGALIALQTTAGIDADGHWGPATKAALADDANRRVIAPARLMTTAADLRAQGSLIAIGGRNLTWSSVSQILVAALGLAQWLLTNWEGGTDALPAPLGALVAFMPPWVAPVLVVAFNVYNGLVAQGIVKARVQAERTGLHNGEPEPAPIRPPEVLGGFIGSVLGGARNAGRP
jgi:putative chitinase